MHFPGELYLIFLWFLQMHDSASMLSKFSTCCWLEYMLLQIVAAGFAYL